MYEIWLVINILWEIALSVWPLLAVSASPRTQIADVQ